VATPAPAQEVVDHVAPTSTTTTTAPPAPTTTTTTSAPESAVGGGEHEGQVTYYAHPAGGCASPWLPFGTVVRVTNPANGASVTCVVNDREADTERAIDLATATFAEIAPLSQGVIDAELSW
jgi:rare lipoprotein A